MGKLKLEVGKTYLNKKGEYINIVGTSPYDNGYQVFVGIDSNDETSSYYQDGEYNQGAGQCDLVSEHKEPVVHERWVTWFRYNKNDILDTRLTDKKPTTINCNNWGESTILKQEKITYEEK